MQLENISSSYNKIKSSSYLCIFPHVLQQFIYKQKQMRSGRHHQNNNYSTQQLHFHKTNANFFDIKQANVYDYNDEHILTEIQSNNLSNLSKTASHFNITDRIQKNRSNQQCKRYRYKIKNKKPASKELMSALLENQRFNVGISDKKQVQIGCVDQPMKMGHQEIVGELEFLERGEILELLEKYRKQNKQNCAIKAYNNTIGKCNQLKDIGIVDSPQTINYIIQAMQSFKKTERGSHFKKSVGKMQKKIQRSHNQFFQCSSENISPRHHTKDLKSVQTRTNPFSELQRKKRHEEIHLNKLKAWLDEKLQESSTDSLSTNSSIINHLHILHLGFSETFRQISKYSNKISQILVLLHSQYHTFYENLISTLMSHNKNLKVQFQKSSNHLNETISHYEKQLLNIRADFDKKSSKVIENFHKCINIKTNLEKDVKMYAHALKEEKNKIKYMEECLAKAIQILVEIGNEKFNFLTPEQEKMIMALSGTFKLCPEDCKLFYQWCSTIIRNITTMKNTKKNTIKNMNETIDDFALSTIGKFMIDTDSSLSIQEVKEILNNYVPNYKPNIIQITPNNDSQTEEIKQIKLRVPDLHDIREMLNGKDQQVQVNCNFQYESKAIQSIPEYEDFSVMVKPSVKQKQTCTIIWIQDRMSLCSNLVNSFIWGERQEEIKPPPKKVEKRDSYSRRESIRVQMLAPPIVKNTKQNNSKKMINQSTQTFRQLDSSGANSNQPSKCELYSQNLDKQKEKTKKDEIRLSGKFEQESNPNRNLSSKRKPRKSRKVGFSVNGTAINEPDKNIEPPKHIQKVQKKQSEKMEEQILVQSLKNRSKSVKYFNEQIIQEAKGEDEDQSKQDLRKLRNLSHRKGILATNLEKFVDQIVNMRSMKNLKVNLSNIETAQQHSQANHQKQNEFHRTHYENCSVICHSPKSDKILLNLIKIPRKLLIASKFQQYSGNLHSHRVEILERIQERNKAITQSTMWSHKRCTEIQKVCNKLQNSKQKSNISNNFYPNKFFQNQSLKFLLRNQVNPILQFYLKLYKQMIAAQKYYQTGQFRKQLVLAKKIPYYHRLAPLLYNLVNVVSTNFNLKNSNSLSFSANKYYYKELTKIYHEIKSIRNAEKQPFIEIYEELLDGREVELDVFIKVLVHLEQTNMRTSLAKSEANETQTLTNLDQISILLNVAQVQLFLILDDYLNIAEIHTLINEIRSMKKQKQLNRRSGSESDRSIKYDEKISLKKLILKIFKAIKNKKNLLKKRYKGVLELIGINNQQQSVQLHDLQYLLEALPIDKASKNKIIYHSSFYTIYWQKKHASIPYDRVLFLFDSIKFMHKIPEGINKSLVNPDGTLSSGILLQYFNLKIQDDQSLKNTYNTLLHNPDHIAESIYRLLYRVPTIIYKLTQEFKVNGSIKAAGKRSSIMLVLLYRVIILQQIQKIYNAGTLSLLQSISYIFC